MKRKFVVVIEETVSDEFIVYAENESEALETAEQKYKAGEFVLEPGNVSFRQKALVEKSSKPLEWIEF
ncbi:MAG: DpnD/PcfM family protein [Eubacteriales bacterium]|nr:DpnD/PcfM family protein [Eubacteriales bacterium]